MSGAADLEEVYSALEESAGLLNVPCSRDNVWPILTAYGDALTEVAIVFSISTGTQEFDYTVQVPKEIDDPYAHALSNGFIAETGHPVNALLPDIRERITVNDYFFDCGVVGGFQKLYASFPRDLRKVSDLIGIPSMPRAAAENADLFARHGLDDVAVIGVDYKNRTMNFYFQLPAGVGGNLDPKTVLSLLRETGMPEPDEQMLERACASYRIYATLNWESSTIERMSFSPQPRRDFDLSPFQERLQPEIKQFMSGAPYAYEGERISITVPKWTAGGHHLNLGTYYQLSPQMAALVASREEKE